MRQPWMEAEIVHSASVLVCKPVVFELGESSISETVSFQECFSSYEMKKKMKIKKTIVVWNHVSHTLFRKQRQVILRVNRWAEVFKVNPWAEVNFRANRWAKVLFTFKWFWIWLLPNFLNLTMVLISPYQGYSHEWSLFVKAFTLSYFFKGADINIVLLSKHESRFS